MMAIGTLQRLTIITSTSAFCIRDLCSVYREYDIVWTTIQGYASGEVQKPPVGDILSLRRVFREMETASQGGTDASFKMDF